MEKPFLQKIPPEIRLRIYRHAFQRARITVYVNEPPYSAPFDAQPWDDLKDYSHHCNLAFTCRTIKAESTEILWKTAAWEVVSGSTNKEYVWLHYAARVLKMMGVAKYVTHLRGIGLPTIYEVKKWCLEPAVCALRAFPRLQTCGFVVPDDDDDCNICPALILGDRLCRLDWLEPDRAVMKTLLPFTNLSNDPVETIEPLEILDLVGIDTNCKVQMILQKNHKPLSVWMISTRDGHEIKTLPIVRFAPSPPLFFLEKISSPASQLDDRR